MTPVRYSDLPLPVGSTYWYANPALNTEGTLTVVPYENGDEEESDLFVACKGEIIGPPNPGQEALNLLAPGSGQCPGHHEYVVIPYMMLHHM